MSSDTPDIYSDDGWEYVRKNRFNPDATKTYQASPCCYICSHVFDAEIYDSKTSSLNYDSIEICGADEFEDLLVRKAWWTIFRMGELPLKYQIA